MKTLVIGLVPEFYEDIESAPKDGLWGRMDISEEVIADPARFQRLFSWEVDRLLNDLGQLVRGKNGYENVEPESEQIAELRESLQADIDRWRSRIQEELRKRALA